MTSFERYSRHYNALYEDKDYAAEASYLGDIVRRHAPDARRLLDIGCGTGRHAFLFADAGFEVTGIDRSATMLAEARRVAQDARREVEFAEADIRDFDLGARFDVVVAAFHVMSYVTTNDDIAAALRAVRRHLDRDGLFIFDFWYGPGVLTDRPTQRLKTVASGDVEVRRFATPHLDVNDSVVTIDYAILLLEKETARYESFSEQHRLRYYFKPEIDLLLNSAGFAPIEFRRWMSDELPDDRSWNAVVTARAV